MSRPTLDTIDHVAIPVQDVAGAVDWYRSRFGCEVEYQDPTWALLKFQNVRLAFVMPEQHPPHLAFVSDRAAEYGELTRHRDGTESVYIQDPSNNAIEIMAPYEAAS